MLKMTTSWWSSGQDPVLPKQEAGVLTLVRKLSRVLQLRIPHAASKTWAQTNTYFKYLSFPDGSVVQYAPGMQETCRGDVGLIPGLGR